MERTGDSLPTTSLGHYKVRAKIGSGGMGDVFDAVHTGLDKRVAIKTLRKRFLDDEIVVARFLREGQLASRIRHPNIVDVTDVGMMGGLPCLVMEHLEGESLSAMIRREGCLPIETIVDLLLPIIAAVDFAHEHGIVHRDIKPSNIFLSRSWNGEIVPKVLDFGISKLVHDSQQAALTTDSAFVGTPHYASPELMRADKHADGRSDQYSMGVILYEAATAVRPFADLGNNFVALAMAICKGEYIPARERNPELPAPFERVIQRAMALQAQDRFPTMRALGEALLPFANERSRMIWAPTFRGNSGSHQSATEVLRHHAPASTGGFATVQSMPSFPSALSAPSGASPSAPYPVRGSSAPTPVSQHSHHSHRPMASPSGSIPHGSMPSGFPAGYGYGEHPGRGASATPLGAAVDRLPSYGAGSSGPPGTAPRGSAAITIVIGLGLGLAILVSVVLLRGVHREDAARTAAAAASPETFTIDVKVTPPTASIEIDGVAVGTGSVSRPFPRDGKTHTLRVSALGHESMLVEFTDAPPPAALALRPTAASPEGASVSSGAPAAPTGAAAHRGSAFPTGPQPGPAPVGKVKGNSDGRPKTDNINPWE